jgi:hypothetical protein
MCLTEHFSEQVPLLLLQSRVIEAQAVAVIVVQEAVQVGFTPVVSHIHSLLFWQEVTSEYFPAHEVRQVPEVVSMVHKLFPAQAVAFNVEHFSIQTIVVVV